MKLNEKDVIIRIVNNYINYITDDIDDPKLYRADELRNIGTAYLMKTKKYHVNEVTSSDLPIKVDHSKLTKYFVVNSYDVDKVKFLVNDDNSLSLIEILKNKKKTFIVLTYKGKIMDSSFNRSIGIMKDNKE